MVSAYNARHNDSDHDGLGWSTKDPKGGDVALIYIANYAAIVWIHHLHP